jgi:rhamnosyltransferase
LNSGKKISCVIRTRDEGKCIGKCLEMLCSQDGNFDVDIVVVDSGSVDDTLDIVRKHKTKLLHVERKDLKDFDYSYALNIGIEACTGDIVAILSAHSVPVQRDWLLRMTSHFEDKLVAGVYGRQVPWPDADWSEVLRIQNSFGESSQVFSKNEMNGSCLYGFSNAASCIRRDLWRTYPFRLPAAEDSDWAGQVIEKGYKIVYEAQACVYHSHKESVRAAAQRMIALEKAADVRLGRKRTRLLTLRQSLRWLLCEMKTIVTKSHCRGKRLKFSLQAIVRSFWFWADFGCASKPGQPVLFAKGPDVATVLQKDGGQQ